MGFFIKTHIVKNGETLESIAESYGIPNVEILRYFHHQNSPKNRHHLGHQVVVGQKIFIPEKEDLENYELQRENIAEKNRKQRIFHLKNSKLTPNLKFQNHHYKVLITDFSENDKNGNSLEFQADFRYFIKNDIPVLQYHKKNWKFLNDQSDLKLYDLALEISELMYPVEFVINSENTNLEMVANSEFLTKQWCENKGKLLEKYTDDYSLKYIDFVDYAKENMFIDLLKKDLFLQFLFAPYGNYQSGKMRKNFHLGMASILYNNEMLMEILEDKIEIQQHSKSADLESIIAAKYFLDLNHYLIQEAKIEIKSHIFGERKRTEIKIKKIDA